MCAASSGAMGALNLLIASGADLTMETKNGKTALHFAMTRESPEIVRRLMQLGLDPKKASARGGLTPLQLAQKRGHAGTLEVLSELGAA
jgi:ankyrin repeat protein